MFVLFFTTEDMKNTEERLRFLRVPCGETERFFEGQFVLIPMASDAASVSGLGCY